MKYFKIGKKFIEIIQQYSLNESEESQFGWMENQNNFQVQYLGYKKR